MEFKDKIMLHGFREVKCRWEVGEVEGGKGERVMRWQGGKGRRVLRWGRWKVPGFIQGWGTHGKSKILSFRF